MKKHTGSPRLTVRDDRATRLSGTDLPPWLSSGDVVVASDCRTIFTGGKHGSVIKADLSTKKVLKVFGPLSFFGAYTDKVRGVLDSILDLCLSSSSRFSITGQFEHLALSENGEYLVGATKDRTVLWDAESGQKLVTLPDWETWGGLVDDVAISPNGKRAAWCGICTDQPNATGESTPRGVRWFSTILQWSLPDGQPFEPVVGGVGAYRRIAYSPDSRFLVAVGADHGKQKIDLYDDDGPGEPTVQLLDLKSGLWIERFPLYVGNWTPNAHLLRGLPKPAFSPDSRLVAAGDGKVIGVWETGTSDVEQWRLRRDSALLLDKVQIARQVRALHGHDEPVTAITFLPDNRHILSGDRRGWVILWDVETGEVIAREQEHSGDGNVLSILCSPNGKTAISCGSRQYRIWNLSPANG